MVQGVNIYSGSRELNGLAAALTNPTELAFRKGALKSHYPVEVDGVTYPDAEVAYQKMKRRSEQWLNMDALMGLMERVIRMKLRQYPRLVEAIKKNGGSEWLLRCKHVVNGGRWEGIGEESPFIRCLVKAYCWEVPTDDGPYHRFEGMQQRHAGQSA